MFEAIARGEIKALWVMGTNPAVSLPDADAARAALKKLELFVVSENVRSNDTVNAGAHVLLPAQAWGEKSGTVTNSERRISRQRAFLAPPGEAKPDWWIVSEVAKRLGFGAAFDFTFGGGCVPRTRGAVGIRERRQPRFRYRRVAVAIGRGVRGDGAGAVADPLRRGRAAAAVLRRRRIFHQRPQGALCRAGNSGAANRDQHRAAAAAEHRPHQRPMAHHDPHRHRARGLASICRSRSSRSIPTMRAEFGVVDGGFARVATDYGQCILKVVVSERQQRGMLFAPIHWSERDSIRRAGRRAGGAVHRSVFRPAREQGDAGVDHALRICLSRLRAVADAAGIAAAGLVDARRGHRRLRLSARRQRRSGAMAILAAVGRRRRSCRIPGFWRRRLPRGVVCRRPHRNLPVRRARARCRRLGCGQEPVRGRTRSATISAGCCCRANRCDGLASAGPIVCACFGVGRTTICDAIAAGRELRRRDRRAAQGRHQLRLVHSGIEAPDRAGRSVEPSRSIDWPRRNSSMRPCLSVLHRLRRRRRCIYEADPAARHRAGHEIDHVRFASVIARSVSDEAIHLSMRHHGLLRFARNDGHAV